MKLTFCGGNGAYLVLERKQAVQAHGFFRAVIGKFDLPGYADYRFSGCSIGPPQSRMALAESIHPLT
jgi:hypothetical protein